MHFSDHPMLGAPPQDIFWYWINERQKIYIQKEILGSEPQWTQDPILQTFKFTNVFREQDRVTRDLNSLIPRDEGYWVSGAEELLHIIAFRLFNIPETYDSATSKYLLSSVVNKSARGLAKEIRHTMQDRQIFTGAYIVTNAGKKTPKIDLHCEALMAVRSDIDSLYTRIVEDGTLYGAVKYLSEYDLIGKFVAYEIVSDLRHRMLKGAPDVMTWANPGPGAKRGLNRFDGVPYKSSIQDKLAVQRMREILLMSLEEPHHLEWWVPSLEMRDVEHSLCEFDKYCRVLNGEGRPRSKYDPMGGNNG